MGAKQLWVAEHGHILLGESNRCLPNGHLELTKKDFEAFLSLLDEAEEAEGLEAIFRYSKRGGRDRLTVQNYVGVIRTDNGTQVEILPKTSRSIDPNKTRDLLVEMLKTLQDSPFKEGTSADLRAHHMPLFEVLIRQFLGYTLDIVRKGIARTYVPHSDNLVFLRGKLQLTENIRFNAARSSRLYCEFDEYEANRPINRLIRGALDVVERVTQDADNQQICRELLFWFDRVPATRDVREDLRRVQRDRMVQHYEPAMPSCRMILEGLNPLTKRGDRKAISMLFPMERVFEDYVAVHLPKQLKAWRVRSQVSGQALVERHINRKMFGLRPDLELRRGRDRIIADTKWKLLDETDRSNKYGISQADIYQLYAYTKKFLGDQNQKEVLLIYPATDRFQAPLRPFWYGLMNEVLYVVPFDIEAKRLLIPEGSALMPAEISWIG